MVLTNVTWQEVPGQSRVRIFPFTGKPDVSSSQCYLLDFGASCVVIDPGAEHGRAAVLSEQIRGRVGSPITTVIVLLTHCHIDHCALILSENPLNGIPHVIAAHEAAADAIETGDHALTAGDIFRRTITPREVAVRLFSREDRELGVTRSIEIAPGEVVSISLVSSRGEGASLPAQDVTLPDGGTFRVYAIPGHSPDSICIQVGEVLFLGDLLFATAPGIAGIAGFSVDDLVASIAGVRALIAAGGITICCNGHGDPIPAPSVAKALAALEKEAREHPSIQRFDIARLGASSEHALDLLDEAGDLFAVIGGRLLALSHHLEDLEELGEAVRFQKVLDIDLVDEALSGFHFFCEEFAAGKRVDLAVIQKAIQVLGKINRVFSSEALTGAVDLTLIRRAGRLLTDFLGTIRGISPQDAIGVVALLALLNDLVRRVTHPPYSDEEFLSASGDEEAFLSCLVARLAYQPPFPGVSFVVTEEGDTPPVQAGEERLYDALIAISEDFVASGATEIQFRILKRVGAVSLQIAGEGPLIREVFLAGRIRRHLRAFTLAGGSVEYRAEGEEMEYKIQFSLP